MAAAKEWFLLGRPTGNSQNHVFIALGHAAVDAGYKVGYPAAAELCRVALPGGWRTTRSEKVIERILRADAVIVDEVARRHRRSAVVPLCRRRQWTPNCRHRQPLVFEEWGRFLPNETTAVSLLDRLIHHSIVVVRTGNRSAWKRPIEEAALSERPPEHSRGGAY